MNIFVSSLSFRARREDLENLFAPYGEVSSARIITDKVTHRSKGYGFVEMSEEEGKSTAYQLTIDQLKSYQDSILKKLNDTRKELGIKDKRLEVMQYVASSFVKADTIVYRDTIFREPSFAVDTLLGDEWYKI